MKCTTKRSKRARKSESGQALRPSGESELSVAEEEMIESLLVQAPGRGRPRARRAGRRPAKRRAGSASKATAKRTSKRTATARPAAAKRSGKASATKRQARKPAKRK